MKGFPWRTLLFISLALNLLAIGVVVGAAGAGVRLQRGDDAVAARQAAIWWSLPQETRASLRSDLARAFRETAPLRRDARAARRDALRAAAADPYDAAAMKAALARMRAADAAVQAAWHDASADALARLPPEQRAEAMRRIGRLHAAALRRIAED